MANNNFDAYTDRLEAEHKKLVDVLENMPYTPENLRINQTMSAKRDQILVDLTGYFDLVLCGTPKLIPQRVYCKQAIERMNPAFTEGYFSRTKSTKSDG